MIMRSPARPDFGPAIQQHKPAVAEGDVAGAPSVLHLQWVIQAAGGGAADIGAAIVAAE